MRRIGYASTLVFVLLAVPTTFGVLARNYLNVESYELHASQQFNSERLKELRRLIDSEIGVPHANDLSQCRLLEIGASCPHRQKFLAYSTAKTSESKLKQLVGQYNQVEKQRSLELKLWCPWMTARKPKLEFTDGVCIAVDELKQKWEEWRRNKVKESNLNR